MEEKRFILQTARSVCQRNADKADMTVSKLSDKLVALDDNNSSVKHRANVRAALSIKCEERDRWLNRIDIINKWMKEIE